MTATVKGATGFVYDATDQTTADGEPRIVPPAPLRILTRADILGAEDRVRELVDVPEWGGSVWVRALEGLERDRYEGAMVAYRRNSKGSVEIDRVVTDNIRARLVALSCVDEDWKGLFTEADVLALGRRNAQALNRVVDVANRLSGLTERDVEALKAEMAEDPTAASPSASPGTSG